MKLIEMTLSDYLDVLGSDAPAPGGGSAAALCGAQGAGLIAMVAGLTIGKKKYAEVQENCQAVLEEETQLMKKLKGQIDKDTEAFNLVSAAFKMPRETEEQKAERSAAIQAGTLVSTEVPFETMGLALDALRCAEKLLAGFNSGAASDLGVGAWNLRSCVQGAWYNVLINIGSLKDTEKAEDFRIRGEKLLAEAEALAEKLRARAEAEIRG